MSCFDIPCEGCVCVPICRNKEVKPMFNQCKLLMDFFKDFIGETTNQALGQDMMDLCDLLNETLDRFFMPSIFHKDEKYNTVGLIDIDPANLSENNRNNVILTYRVFKNAFKIDMLKSKRLGPFLSNLLPKIDK